MEFVIALIALSYFGWVATSWIRARHGYPVEGEWGGTVTKSDPDASLQRMTVWPDRSAGWRSGSRFWSTSPPKRPPA